MQFEWFNKTTADIYLIRHSRCVFLVRIAEFLDYFSRVSARIGSVGVESCLQLWPPLSATAAMNVLVLIHAVMVVLVKIIVDVISKVRHFLWVALHNSVGLLDSVRWHGLYYGRRDVCEKLVESFVLWLFIRARPSHVTGVRRKRTMSSWAINSYASSHDLARPISDVETFARDLEARLTFCFDWLNCRKS